MTTTTPQYPEFHCITCYATTELLNHPQTHNPDATPETFHALTEELVWAMSLVCGHTVTQRSDGTWKVDTDA